MLCKHFFGTRDESFFLRELLAPVMLGIRGKPDPQRPIDEIRTQYERPDDLKRTG